MTTIGSAPTRRQRLMNSSMPKERGSSSSQPVLPTRLTLRADGVFPVIIADETAAGPANDGRMEIVHGFQQVGTEAAVGEGGFRHQADLIDPDGRRAAGHDFQRGVGGFFFRVERERKLGPVF